MTSSFRILFGGLILGGSLGALPAQQVVAPSQRQTSVDAAKTLLAPKDVAVQPKLNPFNSTAFAEALGKTTEREVADGKTPVQPAGPRTDRELLAAIAAGLKPSGSIVLAGDTMPTLVFGQKRVKAGGTLTITFESKEYVLEVTAIDRTSFTLRLNNEVYTRPIR